MSDHDFVVEPRLRLILTDVSAVVRVRRGAPGAATVTLAGGGEEYAAALRIRFDAAENVLDVREAPPQGVVTVTVAGSGVVVGAGNVVSGGGSGNVVAGPGATVVSSAGRIVVNGVDVTDQVDPARRGSAEASAQKPVEPPVVTVVVPEGTDVGAERCGDLTLDRIRGRVRATVAGQSRLVAREACAARLTVAGVSRAELRRSGGPVALTVAGQSQVRLDGSFGDVGLELSGQASVVGSGSFGRVTGHAAGMARVDLSGSVEDEAVRTSGMASVRVGGPPSSGSATGDDWDF